MKFELDIIRWLQDFRTDFLDKLFEFFTMFGEEVILILILGFIYWCYNKKLGEKLGLTVFISTGLNSVLKIIFLRPRPFVVDSEITNIRPSTSPGYSMPSGHTQTASTTYFSLYYNLKKRWVLILAIIITVLVAISRMYIGVHYLTDVLVGGLLGLLIAYLVYKFFPKIKNQRKFYNILVVITNIILIIIIIITYISNSNSEIDAYNFFLDSESVAKMFGTVSGFLLAMNFEKKYVNFTNHNILIKNIIRLVLGVAVILVIRVVLSMVFELIIDSETLVAGQGFKAILALFLDYLRYLIMLFIGIGVYPILFKKIKI